MAEIVAAARFETMRAQGDTLMPFAGGAWVDGARTFINKGVNGRWHECCAPKDIAAYEAAVAAAFTPPLAAWLQGGRLVAGDPALAPD
jgi:aryl sulfotransferase